MSESSWSESVLVGKHYDNGAYFWLIRKVSKVLIFCAICDDFVGVKIDSII